MRLKSGAYIILALIILSFGGAYLYQELIKPEPKSPPSAILPAVEKSGREIINSAIFNCADSKTIQALFFQDKVELTLSDGRNLLLAQAISASGARYVNPDESFVFWNKGDSAFVLEGDKTTFSDCRDASQAAAIGSSSQIANPASTNCLESGGKLRIQKRGDGGEYGICFFEDNRQCEEWALFRSLCPVGGLKVTGYENEAQIFCVITGGKIEGLGSSEPICQRTDGTKCTVSANFRGECPDPNDPNPNAGNTETP